MIVYNVFPLDYRSKRKGPPPDDGTGLWKKRNKRFVFLLAANIPTRAATITGAIAPCIEIESEEVLHEQNS